MAQLEDSEKLCREALRALLQAPLPPKVEIADREVELRGDATEDELRIEAKWDGGELQFRLRAYGSTLKRAKDVEPTVGVQAFAERNKREVNWISFEWAIRDAIRDGKDEARLIAYNSYRGSKEATEAGWDARALGVLSRAMAAQSGLGSDAALELGHWSLSQGKWLPSAQTALENLVKLIVIKTHFFDRAKGEMVSGVPLFALGVVPEEPREERAPQERLSGLPRLPGSFEGHWDTLLEILSFVVDTRPALEELTQWFAEHYRVRAQRTYHIYRFLLHTGLARLRADRMELTAAGAELLEARAPQLLFDALRRSYTGFEETLTYLARHPGARAPALRDHLNAALGTKWEVDLQARIRAEWLATCGLARVQTGRFFLTDEGMALAEEMDAPVELEEVEEVSEEEGYEDPDDVQLRAEMIEVKDLVLPPGLIERCCAALNSKKHLLLIGPPGTGKSTLAERLGAAAAQAGICEEALTATASADWTTYDTIGGWTQRSDGSLAFREGVFTRALRERRWLVIDEVNRADIDKSFGELFTVLSGNGRVTTPFTRRVEDTDVPVEIGPDSPPYATGPWFRIIATMNIRDKASLFRLSFAFMRRFAVVVVPALGDDDLRQLGERVAKELGVGGATLDLALRTMSGLGKFAPLGPSLLIDILRYAQARNAGPERAVAEAVGMVVVPQLENLTDGPARDADKLFDSLFGADKDALRELRHQFRSNFPDVFDFAS